MERNDPRYQVYVEILKEELIPAMGCTEPIALAYAAAKAREVLGVLPDSVQLQVSGSIIKNVKSVIVPNTGHLKGMEAAVAAGIIAGSAEKELEVISEVSEEKKSAIRDYLQTVPITIEHTEQGHVFDIVVTERCGQDYARVRIADYHTNICRIEKNGTVLYEVPLLDETADLRDVADLLERQIRYNNAIAEEGLLGDYGANIGRVLLTTYGNDVSNRAKAKAAAGSDARMNGCELPVIINSGSGNQGITCSVPLIEYAKELHSGKEKLYRALIISNLVAIHEKTGIGTLSAYCGAVSAGAGAGAGIVYLCGDGYQAAIHTVVNALAIVSGIVCDGAKASCAAKIASSVDAALLGYNMYKCNQEFKGGDGIVMKDIETTIKGIGRLGKDGMRQTNEEIIRLMMS
ncbi:serine dehydratase subunit alpha family protein [Faecalibacterium duncaniae]|uniref:L-cysteine desulfidase family protein n=1 Tax=Faecalibacterium duncaniae (strain DSM 17677 / JCM 31915 / A2-165) TaxID=411483 RepID=UPI003EDA1B44